MKYFVRAVIGTLILLGVSIAIFYRSDIPVDELSARYADKVSKFVEVDGMMVHYKKEGNTDAPTLVLLHGTASSLHTWDGWVSELDNDFSIIRMDLPAFGLTGPNKDNDYSMESYVAFLHAFLRQLGIRKFSLVGNSLGGRIAWNYAATYPDEVDKLVLIDASGYPKEDATVPLAFKIGTTPGLKYLMQYVSPRPLYVKSIKEVYADDSKVTDELVDRYYELSLRTGNREALVARMGQAFSADTTAISSLSMPTMIMWGEADVWIPLEDAERFHRDIRSSILRTYEQVGHVPMEESPKITAADVRSFLLDQ